MTTHNTHPMTSIAADALRKALRGIFHQAIEARVKQYHATETVEESERALADARKALEERQSEREELDRALADLMNATPIPKNASRQAICQLFGVEDGRSPHRTHYERAEAATIAHAQETNRQ